MNKQVLRASRSVLASSVAVLSVLAVTTLTSVATAGPIDLGEAGMYGIFQLGDGQLSMSNSQTTILNGGNVALGPGGKQNFSEGHITGTYYVDPTADNTKSNNVVKDGGTVTTDLSSAVADALAAATAASALTADLTINSNLGNGSSIDAGAAACYVVDLNGSISLSGDGLLTLNGSASTWLILNISGGISLSGTSAITLTGGLTVDHVVFNIEGDGDVSQSGDSTINGIILATNSGSNYSNSGAFLNGAAIIGGDISLTSGAQLDVIPEPTTFLLVAAACGGLVSTLKRRRA